MIGVEFIIRETKNVKVQTYIDKFKKDYPDLKQQGSIYPDKNNTKNTEKINAKITEAYQKLNTLKNKLLPNNINKLTQKELKSIQQEIFDIQKDLIYKTQALSIQSSTSKQPELKLYNDNVSISFKKSSHIGGAIEVTVTDAKLLDYRKKLDKEFDKIVKEYDKKMEAKREKELLNF